MEVGTCRPALLPLLWGLWTDRISPLLRSIAL